MNNDESYTPPQVIARRAELEAERKLIDANPERYQQYVDEYRTRGFSYDEAYYYASDRIKRES